MLSDFQRRWGISQWVAFLKDQEIPVLPGTRQKLAALREEKRDRIAPKELAAIVLEDPFLALKLLRRVEGHRSQTLSQETTTALGAVLQAGVDDLMRTVNNAVLANESLPGLHGCAMRNIVAARIARDWASMRADISAEEVTLATLLSESGELLLWHFAPELPQNAIDELNSGRALRTLQAQQQATGFSFKQMNLALVEAWALPQLITQLIRGFDTPRANIARIAGDTARHIITHPENPALPADLVNIKQIIHGVSIESLIAPLPISDDYKAQVLLAVAEDNYSKDFTGL
jgi:HD-like signal output (HDOD) protein